jgi:hypothetical protein
MKWIYYSTDMDTNSKYRKSLSGPFGLIVLIGLVVGCNACNERPFASEEFAFILPINVAPIDSVFNIGDTLWVTADFDEYILDYFSNERYRLNNITFASDIGLIEIEYKDKRALDFDQPGATAYFDFIVEKGRILGFGTKFSPFDFDYSADSGNYTLKIGLIPKKKGIFVINFLSPIEFDLNELLDLGIAENGAKIIPHLFRFFFPINDGENNYDFKLKHSIPNHTVDISIGAYYYDRMGSFTFRVRESNY